MFFEASSFQTVRDNDYVRTLEEISGLHGREYLMKESKSPSVDSYATGSIWALSRG